MKGDRTRQSILERAVDIASVEGLEGLTIGRLADELDMSKSGLFAHFGSKEDLQLATIAETEPYKERVGWLRCFRGIDTLTAILILAELHDFRRFPSPRALMAFLGLVPGEDSSGEKHRRGRITRTGNALKWEATVDDPEYLAKPWSVTPVTRQLNTDSTASLVEPLPCQDIDHLHTTSHVRSG